MRDLRTATNLNRTISRYKKLEIEAKARIYKSVRPMKIYLKKIQVVTAKTRKMLEIEKIEVM